ncbi:MAG: MFS transporter, partial [Candidatus Limnocylindria bacterium]
TAVFATGIAFMFPALMAVAVGRVEPGERGAVVGTTSAFMDLSFGLAPATLGLLVTTGGYGPAFVVSGVVALVGAVALVTLRERMRPAEPVRAISTAPTLTA